MLCCACAHTRARGLKHHPAPPTHSNLFYTTHPKNSTTPRRRSSPSSPPLGASSSAASSRTSTRVQNQTTPSVFTHHNATKHEGQPLFPSLSRLLGPACLPLCICWNRIPSPVHTHEHTPPNTGRSRGIAFVQFNTHQEASAAIAGLHETMVEGSVGGRPLVVKLADDSRGTLRRVCAHVYAWLHVYGAVCVCVCIHTCMGWYGLHETMVEGS